MRHARDGLPRLKARSRATTWAAPRLGVLTCQPSCTLHPPAGDLYVELSRRGGYMAEAHVVKSVLIPFLSALTYMHAQVGAA